MLHVGSQAGPHMPFRYLTTIASDRLRMGLSVRLDSRVVIRLPDSLPFTLLSTLAAKLAG